jgi:hypothetical protein
MSLLPLKTFASPDAPLFGSGGGGGGGSIPANLAVSTLYVAGDGTGKNIFCQNSLSPNQGLYLNCSANSTMSMGYSNAVGFQTYIDTGSMMPQSSGNYRWQTRFQNPVEIIPGRYGVYDFSDTLLTITQAGISVPALTNISSINGVPYSGGGGGGPTSTRLPLSSAFSTGTGSVPANGSVQIINNFSVVAGHTYTITWGNVEEASNVGNWMAYFGIPSFSNYAMTLATPTKRSPISFSFRATANASDASIFVLNNNPSTPVDIFVTTEPNVGVCVLTDLGVI